MLSWITEKQDVWQRLQSCNKPVVVYGMGDGAVKILQVMQRYGIRPAAMFASDDFARGNSFMGYTVGKLRDVQAVYDDFIIVLAFAVRDLPTIERIRALSQQYELVAPDVPVAGVEQMGLADRATCVQRAAYSHWEMLEFDSRAGRQSALREPSLVTGVQGAAKAKIRQVQGQALDELAGEHPVTLINMDVEGAERLALQGCRQVITRDRPKMLIAAYHRSEDLFALPQQIAAIRPDYRFYLRHYRYIPAWDVNLYCV